MGFPVVLLGSCWGPRGWLGTRPSSRAFLPFPSGAVGAGQRPLAWDPETTRPRRPPVPPGPAVAREAASTRALIPTVHAGGRAPTPTPAVHGARAAWTRTGSGGTTTWTWPGSRTTRLSSDPVGTGDQRSGSEVLCVDAPGTGAPSPQGSRVPATKLTTVPHPNVGVPVRCVGCPCSGVKCPGPRRGLAGCQGWVSGVPRVCRVPAGTSQAGASGQGRAPPEQGPLAGGGRTRCAPPQVSAAGRRPPASCRPRQGPGRAAPPEGAGQAASEVPQGLREATWGARRRQAQESLRLPPASGPGPRPPGQPAPPPPAPAAALRPQALPAEGQGGPLAPRGGAGARGRAGPAAPAGGGGLCGARGPAPRAPPILVPTARTGPGVGSAEVAPMDLVGRASFAPRLPTPCCPQRPCPHERVGRHRRLSFEATARDP